MLDAVAGAERAPARLTLSQLQLVRDQLRRSPYVIAVIDLFIAWMLVRVGVSALALAWVAFSAALQMGRALHVDRMVRRGHTTGTDARAVEAWFFANGLTRIWPIAVAFSADTPAVQHVLTVVMIGLAAGGVGTAAGLLRAYIAWLLPVGVALVVGWWWLGGFESRAIAVLLVLLFVLLSFNVRAYGATLARLRQEVERANAERDRAEIERARANDEWHRAETAVLAKTRFFAAASHDLRQPLAVLRWYGDAVRVHAQRLGHDPLMVVGEGIERALQHAEPLVHKYLDIARIEAGALELVPRVLDVPALLEQIRQQFAVEADARGLDLTVHLGASREALAIETDESVLCNIIDNLVGNAIKFTNAGKVELRAERVPGPVGMRVRIAVRDTGIGIAASDQEQVFEDFYQVGNAERNRSKGLGLGLAIVRRQVRLIGASLRVDSQPGAGSCFEIELPAAAIDLDPVAAAAAPSWPAPTVRALHVLVIDDEPEVRQALCVMLEAVGWQVSACAGLADALAVWQDGRRTDAIIVDYRLQGAQTGAQVVDALRAAGCDAAAVIVTGDTAPERLLQLAQTGLPVLHKPVQGERLVATVLEAIAVAEAA